MFRQIRGRVPLAAAWLVTVLAATCQEGAGASASERAAIIRNGDAMRGLQACAALDLHQLTLIEEAGAVVGADHDAIAEVGWQILAARRLCREARFGEALDTYTRLATEELAVRWLR